MNVFYTNKSAPMPTPAGKQAPNCLDIPAPTLRNAPLQQIMRADRKITHNCVVFFYICSTSVLPRF